MTDTITRRLQNINYAVPAVHASLYGPDPVSPTSQLMGFSASAKLGLRLPNLAPEVEPTAEDAKPAAPAPTVAPFPLEPEPQQPAGPNEPKKKKYAKEAWPGKKPVPSLLM
jgi:nuclear inhibitor of protein phosphatase 1